MRYYKKFQDKNCSKRMISRMNFEEDDMKEEHWHIIGTDGKVRNFAVCSACNNPIQLIGLYEPLKNARHPYGKHTGKRIEGFPYFNPDDYQACPYYSRNRKYSKDQRRKSLSPVILKMLQFLRDEFDRVIVFTEKFSGFSISENLAEKMLLHYLSGCYLYTGGNLHNIPWTFAYMTGTKEMFRQTVYDQSLKQAILDKVQNAHFSESDSLIPHPSGNYYRIQFQYIVHVWKDVDGDLCEEMKLSVHQEGQSAFWTKTIIFDHEDQKQVFDAVDRTAWRNRKILKKGQEIINARFPNLDQKIKESEAKSNEARQVVQADSFLLDLFKTRL